MELDFEKYGQQLTVLSFGAGQDSTAILVRIIEDARFKRDYVVGQLIVVFADTKNEHAHTYAYISYIKMICKVAKIPFVVVEPEKWAGGKWKQGLVGFWKQNKAVGSKAFPKTCTDQLKIRPIYKWLEEFIHITFETKSVGKKKAFYEYFYKYGKVRVLIGIASGEESRASNEPTGMKWFDECVEKIYPLIEQKMDREACQQTINAYGYVVPKPSNCMFCPFLSLQELLYLSMKDPGAFLEWVEIEAEKLKNNEHKGEKNLTVWGTRKTLPEMREIAMEKYGHWTMEQLEEYKMSHGHCVKSKY